ncbi:MAG TPA: hypothetical protein DHV48_12920 [Prolixibacteraceae bacterium]|nr:hypothetical protein [Prolixibacteraceae bacterium]
MKTPTFDTKKEYEKFVSDLKTYHEEAASFNGPEEMFSQFNGRFDILGNVTELCNLFACNSVYILDAFDQYKASMQKYGVNTNFSFFTGLTNCMIKLLAEKEELYKWLGQLSNETKYMEKTNVWDMSVEDINRT